MDTSNEIDNVYLARLYLRLGTGFDEQIKLCVLITNESAFVQMRMTSGLIIKIMENEYLKFLLSYLKGKFSNFNET